MRAVRHGSAAEVVATDCARKPLADRDPGDLHLLPWLELVDRKELADLMIWGVAELDQCPGGGSARLLQVSELRLAELALRHLSEGELHGSVAVSVGVADGGDRTRAGLDHRDGDPGAVLREHLRHPELLADDRRHQMI